MTTTFLLNNLLAFIEGFALIISPCILPILPIILAGAIEGGRRRPLGIIFGFVLTFALFTFFSRDLVQHLAINLDLLRQIAFGLIFIFGLILFSDYLSEKFNRATQGLANVGSHLTANGKPGFLSGFILGLLISLVWVPCGGPILAAAIVQTAIQTTNWQSFFTFFFFALGSVIPMLIIAFLGRKIMSRLNFLKAKTHVLRKIFGIIIMLAAIISAFYGSSAASTMPQAPNVIPPTSTDSHHPAASLQLMDGLSQPYSAPNFPANAVWLNSPALNMADLKGKVVLIDFWTYSCINCVRTLPYLKEWYQRYHKEGFVIIGVHAPEFEFEKNINNVKNAIAKYQIPYPIMLDNEYTLWQAYENQYWPAHYLIDKNGKVVYQHFGEGNYAETENNIRFLLNLSGQVKDNSSDNHTLFSAQTPETYLGYRRVQNYAGAPELTPEQTANYQFPSKLYQNDWALNGRWKVEAEKIISAQSGAAIQLHFRAKKVFAVMGNNSNQPMSVKILLNGKPVNAEKGKDVMNSEISIKGHALYEILDLPENADGILTLISTQPQIEFYTFTFGSE